MMTERVDNAASYLLLGKEHGRRPTNNWIEKDISVRSKKHKIPG